MEISRLKNGGLFFKTKSANFVLNPEIKGQEVNADSQNIDFALSEKANLDFDIFQDQKRIFSWPGEYEVKGVAVHSFPILENTDTIQNSILFVIYTEEGKVCYLPELTDKLDAEIIETIGDTELLIAQLKGNDKLIIDTLESIEPKAFLPLDSEGGLSVDAILSKIGQSRPEAQNKVTIKSKNDLDSEKLTVFLLS